MEYPIEPAPAGCSDEQKAIWDVFCEARNVAMRKNHDYGGSVFQSPPIAPQMAPESAILVRCGDKINRLRVLLSGEPALVKESIEDTVMDAGTYFLLYLACKRLHNVRCEDVAGGLCATCANWKTCPVSQDEPVKECVEYRGGRNEPK